MAPPRKATSTGEKAEAVDQQTEHIDFGSESVDASTGQPVGDIGPMQPRRKDIPGFVLPGTTGPKACRGEVCDSIEDPFPDDMYPGGPPHATH